MIKQKIAKIIEVWPGAYENENQVIDAGLKIEYEKKSYNVEVIFSNVPDQGGNYPKEFNPTLSNVKSLINKEIVFEFSEDKSGIKMIKILNDKNEN